MPTTIAAVKYFGCFKLFNFVYIQEEEEDDDDDEEEEEEEDLVVSL